MAAFAMTGFAQQYQQYFRVEFDMPISNAPTGQTSVASGMKDDWTFCNPDNPWLDFPAGGNLTAVGTWGEMGFRSTTSTVNEYSTMYLENGRTSWTTVGNTAPKAYPFQVDHITKISCYSIPVVPVNFIDSNYVGKVKFFDNIEYDCCDFTFDRLPRNVAELKTLMEPNGNRTELANNPRFVAAVAYLVWPRVIDCSEDAHQMVDYLFGTQYAAALKTVGISNQSWQNLCIGKFTGNGYNDGGGARDYNHLFQWFAGATPANCYKPNGKGYGYDNGPYKVRVAWSRAARYEQLTNPRSCTVANVLLMPNPDAQSKSEAAFESGIDALVVKLQSTKNNGWFLLSNEKTYYGSGKDQNAYDDF